MVKRITDHIKKIIFWPKGIKKSRVPNTQRKMTNGNKILDHAIPTPRNNPSPQKNNHNFKSSVPRSCSLGKKIYDGEGNLAGFHCSCFSNPNRGHPIGKNNQIDYNKSIRVK